MFTHTNFRSLGYGSSLVHLVSAYQFLQFGYFGVLAAVAFQSEWNHWFYKWLGFTRLKSWDLPSENDQLKECYLGENSDEMPFFLTSMPTYTKNTFQSTIATYESYVKRNTKSFSSMTPDIIRQMK